MGAQPLDLSVTLTAELKTVEDVLVLARVLTDLRMSPALAITDDTTIVLDVPVQYWSLENADSLHAAPQVRLTLQ